MGKLINTFQNMWESVLAAMRVPLVIRFIHEEATNLPKIYSQIIHRNLSDDTPFTVCVSLTSSCSPTESYLVCLKSQQKKLTNYCQIAQENMILNGKNMFCNTRFFIKLIDKIILTASSSIIIIALKRLDQKIKSFKPTEINSIILRLKLPNIKTIQSRQSSLYSDNSIVSSSKTRFKHKTLYIKENNQKHIYGHKLKIKGNFVLSSDIRLL